jgi:arylsulfatase A-like enzyme
MLDSPKFLLALLLAMVALFVVTQIEIKRDERPLGTAEDLLELAERDDLNVLYILIDTLRSDRLSAYGYERKTSPVLDYLAETGIRFANHHSQSSWTKTSMASLWTGLFPNRVGVLRAQDALPEEFRVPAQILRDAGYMTIGIWRNGWIAPNFGFGQGFDVYNNPGSGLMPGGLRKLTRAGRVPSSDLDVVLSTRDFLRSYHDQRFFLYLHLMDVHQYLSDDESAIFGNSYSDSYDNSILWTDRQVGAVIAELERLGLRNKTLIVVVSDHGEAFGEHGAEGHARDLHAETTTTPWIMSLPSRLSPGIVVSNRSSNVDVWPTLLDLLGLESLEQSDGRSLVSTLVSGGNEPESTRPDFAQLDQTWGQIKSKPKPSFGVQKGSYRLIRKSVVGDSGDSLYDLKRDPGEQSSVAEENPEVLEDLRAALEEYEEEGPVFDSVPHIELNDMELRQLRALGYAVQ